MERWSYECHGETMSLGIHRPGDPSKCGHPDCTGTPESYLTYDTVTIRVEKIAAYKKISRRGIPLAMAIAVRRLKRYANRNNYQLCSPPEFVDPGRDHRYYNQCVYVYARVIPKGYLPENTMINSYDVKVAVKPGVVVDTILGPVVEYPDGTGHPLR